MKTLITTLLILASCIASGHAQEIEETHSDTISWGPIIRNMQHLVTKLAALEGDKKQVEMQHDQHAKIQSPVVFTMSEEIASREQVDTIDGVKVRTKIAYTIKLKDSLSCLNTVSGTIEYSEVIQKLEDLASALKEDPEFVAFAKKLKTMDIAIPTKKD